ncbi:MAG: CinA family protein [Victivallales bacterium]|nr:CinA family protein [Victivallales bacterium]
MDKETIIESLAMRLGNQLKARGLTLSTAESCTGGGIAAILTDIPGASAWFSGGFVTYSNEWKMKQLGVSAETLERYGAVSSETVGEMLDGLLENGGADLGIAVSGIAGPGGGTPEKPVGTVYVGVARKDWKWVQRFQFEGGRADVRRATAETALNMMLEEIKKI